MRPSSRRERGAGGISQKTPRASTALLVAFVALVLLVAVAPLGAANAETLGTWTKTTPYPTTNQGAVCVTSSGYLYCIDNGGAAYYGKLYPYGVGTWAHTTSYPLDISSESCVSSGGYIYCVSGFCNSIENPGCSPHPEAPTTEDYYAPLGPTGIGPWEQTSSIIEGGLALSCAANSGYLYCIGGFQTVGADPTAHDYYAPLSASGIGTWSNTTAYPTVIQSQTCASSGSYIYCIGGGTGNGNQIMDSTYYARISSSGVSTWTKSSSYPTDILDPQCTTWSGYIYCMGGSLTGSGTSTPAVNYAVLPATGGIGMWASANNYPDAYLSSCISSSGHLYCVGTQKMVYYTSISAPITSRLTATAVTSSGSPLTGYYVVLFQSGNIVAAGDTPATFTLNDGQSYVVQADSYGNCVFNHWSNGHTSASMAVSITTDMHVTAVYDCSSSGASSFTVTSQAQNGAWIFGYYAILESGGAGGAKVVGTGYTAQTFATNAGQSYTIQVDNYGSCSFSHWSNDGSTANPRQFTAVSRAIGLTAVYSCT
jgi:hypothetical protein